jgi:Tol biopolymer transport system component
MKESGIMPRYWTLSLWLWGAVLAAVLLSGASQAGARPVAGTTTRVSVSSGGQQANGDSEWANLSANGRFVVFESRAYNLVPTDTNGVEDIFVHDRQTGITTIASIASNGTLGNARSGYSGFGPAISADGRYVVFDSDADTLVPGDTNNSSDTFLRDNLLGLTERVSIANDGSQGNYGSGGSYAASPDGRYVAFDSYSSNLVAGDTNGVHDSFVRDRLLNTTVRASVNSAGVEGNSYSFGAAISGDGRYVAFHSEATNLVTGDTNGQIDVFVRDLQTNTTVRASVNSTGAQGNNRSTGEVFSPDGRYLVFVSAASTLVPNDTNGAWDVFVRDLQTNTTTRASVDSAGVQGNASSGMNINLYEHVGIAISPDGRYVAFASAASNLVAGDTNGQWDIFVHDQQTGETKRVSLSSAGNEGNGISAYPSLATDPNLVGFGSYATNLVPGDTNGAGDAFTREELVLTPTPTATPTVTGTPPTATPTVTGTPPTATPTVTGTPTQTPSPANTATPTATVTPLPTSTALPTAVCVPPHPVPWTVAAPLPTAVRAPAVESDGTYVYAFGGYCDCVSGPISQAVRYDPASNSWTALAPMPDPVFEAMIVYAGARLYVIGGDTNATIVNVTRIYDVAANTWSYGAPMPLRRSGAAAGFFGGRIYIAGGKGDDGYAHVETFAYDIGSNTWSTGADMPVDRAWPASELYAGQLFVFGGSSGYGGGSHREVYAYDVTTDTWRQLADMPTARYSMGSAILHGRIWVFGGNTAGGAVTTNEIYDPAANAWSTGPSLNVARWRVGGAAAGFYLAAVGGENFSAGLDTTEIALQNSSVCIPAYLPAWLYNANQP